MRPHRIFQAVNSSVIRAHLISRALDRKMIPDDLAKEKSRALLARQCAFAQTELVTFCLMSNHWHLCISLDTATINPLQDAPDEVCLDHLGLIYSETEVQKIGWQLEGFRAGGGLVPGISHIDCQADPRIPLHIQLVSTIENHETSA